MARESVNETDVRLGPERKPVVEYISTKMGSITIQKEPAVELVNIPELISALEKFK